MSLTLVKDICNCAFVGRSIDCFYFIFFLFWIWTTYGSNFKQVLLSNIVSRIDKVSSWALVYWVSQGGKQWIFWEMLNTLFAALCAKYAITLWVYLCLNTYFHSFYICVVSFFFLIEPWSPYLGWDFTVSRDNIGQLLVGVSLYACL